MSTPTSAAARRWADAPGGDVPSAAYAVRRAWRHTWLLLALCAWVSGCGDPDPGPQPVIDMTPDVGPDSGADALPDAMPDEGPACETGFELQRGDCVDIDECADPASCDDRVDCINLNGGFTCGACPRGFSGNGRDGCVLDCPDGEHDGGDGVCRDDETCASGYTLDEQGDCVPLECPDGQHFDGLDACAPEGTCAEGFEPDRRGDCIAALCGPDEHDDGTGACAPSGECAPGYLLDDGGDCQPLTCPADDALEPNDSPDDATQLPDGTLDAIACDEADVFVLASQDGCAAIVELALVDDGPTLVINDSGGELLATGVPVDGGLQARADVGAGAFAVVDGRGAYRISTTYAGHDGGDGACVDRGTCSEGWALEGDACTRCAQGYRDGGDARCVPYGQCAEGYAITLLDECRAVAECPEGLVDNGMGQCQGQCAAGFQPGGGEPDLCLPLGDCQAGARDRGDGACGRACAGGTVSAGEVCVEDHGCETDDPVEQAEAGGPVGLISGQPRFGVVCEGDDDRFRLDLARGCDARIWLRFDPDEGRLALDAPADPDLIAVDAPGGQRLIIDGAPGAVDLRVRGIGGAAARYALRVDTDPDQHDGGDGTCYPRAECAPNYRPDDDGDCSLCTAGAHDGGDGSCVPRGECADGFHDGGAGACIAADRCIAGFHDGGDGSCIEADRCIAGFHDGGDGACIEADRCIAGFHDGNGADPANPCRPVGTCVRGWHDGGDGVCVPADRCSPDHIARGDGGCTLNAALATDCAEGYDFVFAEGGRCDCGLGTRDGGDGRCTPHGACSPGFHPSRPDGPCVPVGACEAGHHATPWGDCRATALCDAGERDDGIGRCVALGAGCADGFFDRGGACAAAPFCAPAAHDGGDGLCVQSDRCAPGFRLSPAGCVLDAREPAHCTAFDFDDARPIESGPPAGGAICGLAADTLRFAVDHSCGIDLRLVADDPDQLLDVQLFDDARAPLDRAEAIGGRARIWIPSDGPRAGFVRVIPVASTAEPIPYRLDLVRDPSRCAPCPPDSTSDGAGRCIPPADGCAPGHQDGGAGECVPLDRCSPGFRDGGDGLCAPFDACGAEHYLDRSLSCVPLRRCPDGQRDDGASMCAFDCAGALGYHEGGDGTCVARPFCAPGFADDLGGTCIERQPGALCAAGFADASGLCLAQGCPDDRDLTAGPLDAEPLAVDLDGVTREDGSLCPGDTGDWYAVAVRGSALLVRLRFDHGTNDMTLRILDEGGALLAEATSDDDDEVTAISPTDGTVIVEVTGDGRNASYRLDLIRPAE